MNEKKLLIIFLSVYIVIWGAIAWAFPDFYYDESGDTSYTEFTTKEDITTEYEELVLVTTEAETTTEPTTEEPTTEASLFADYEIEALCKMVYGEAGTSPREQKRWVAIVALNHYDRHCNGGYTLWEIVTDRNQFVGYSASHPVTSEIREIVEGVIQDYPSKTNWVDFYYFNSVGDGVNNYFH